MADHISRHCGREIKCYWSDGGTTFSEEGENLVLYREEWSGSMGMVEHYYIATMKDGKEVSRHYLGDGCGFAFKEDTND